MNGDEKADADSRRHESERMAEYDRIAKSGLLDFDFDRYRDSVFYYCMPHDEESESEYKRTMKPPFEISETFKKRIRQVLQTPAPQLYLDHPDLRDMPAKGWDLIQAIQQGFGYWRDNAIDEAVASKAKYVVDKIEENSCEMGVAGNLPSVADYVDDVLDYAASRTKNIGADRMAANQNPAIASTFSCGAISGYVLVESILNHFGDKGVEKLLECTANQETEYLELKTSYLLSEEDRENGESQDELNWNIAQGIIAIANTAGGALVIGIKSDNRTILPVRVIGDVESFLRGKIIQRILPDQRRWNGGRSGMWQSDELPRVEPRLCRYSDGKQSGRVVVILIEPRPKGQCIKLEDAVNRNKCLLLQRKAGVGKDSLRYDSDKFDELDNTRRIERGAYAALLRKLIPNSGVSPIGGSSGAYQFKSVGRGADVSVDPLLRQTDGHQLRCEFHPGDRIDKYSIVERIGGGGMGVVYKVRHFATRKEFALKAFKMVSEDSSLLKERFAAEAKVMMRLDHKGLPKVYGYDYDDRAECLYLVQDLIVGDEGKPQELGGFVVDPGVAEREGKRCISHQIALGWLRQVCEIAEYLHGRKLAHRDITLKNLLVDADGNIKLTDFGIAKVMDPALRDELKCEVTLTVAQVPGTFHYLPPEVREKRKADISPESTDVWAIGVSFFKLLTGKWPDNEQFDDYGWYKTIWGTLLKGMLRTDSSKRMSCAEVLCSLAGYEKTAFQDLEMALGSAAQKNATANCIIVDADNILYGSNEEGPRLLRSMLIALARRGFVPRVYYTKGNRAVEKCRDMLKGIEACVVIECDNAETFMLDDCSRRLWRIVSNDKFSILQAEYKCLQGSGFNGESPLCPYVISNDTFTIAKIGVGGAL